MNVAHQAVKPLVALGRPTREATRKRTDDPEQIHASETSTPQHFHNDSLSNRGEFTAVCFVNLFHLLVPLFMFVTPVLNSIFKLSIATMRVFARREGEMTPRALDNRSPT